MIHSKRIGLALSGGGFRASAFHLGTLRKLHELDILKSIDVFSTISGGSITGASYCLTNKSYSAWEADMIAALSSKSVIRRILFSWVFFRTVLLVVVFLAASGYLLYTPYPYLTFVPPVLLLVVLLKFQFRIFPVSSEVEKAYDRFFYHGAVLKDLKVMPLLAIGSSNIQTGRPFTFSQIRMGDSTYAYPNPAGVVHFKHLNFPLARAVAASSCVPFAFTPISISKAFVNDAQLPETDPKLIDGGVYDNQGIHKLTEPKSAYRCDVVITSDAGNRMFAQQYKNTIGLLVRTVDVFMVRIKNFQMTKNLYTDGQSRDFGVAYLSLGWDLDRSIPGFVSNMASGNIPHATLAAHELAGHWIANPENHRKEIEDHLKTRVGYTAIIKRNLSPEAMKIARSVSTNLTPLSAAQVTNLIDHAANLTELQVKLYCPELVATKTPSYA